MENLILVVTENGRNFVGEYGDEDKLINPVELVVNVVKNKPDPRDPKTQKAKERFTVSFPVKALIHPFLCLNHAGDVKYMVWKIPENCLHFAYVHELQEAVSKQIADNYALFWKKFKENPPKLFIDNSLKIIEKDGKIINLGE